MRAYANLIPKKIIFCLPRYVRTNGKDRSRQN